MARREKGERAKEAILQATLKTISAKKISGTRMREIAKNAHMTQSNLHYYFPTKTDLYVALLDHMLETFSSERVEELQDPDIHPMEKLRCIFKQKIDFILRRREFMDAYYDFWVQATRDGNIRSKMQEQYSLWRRDVQIAVQDGVRLGLFQPTHAEMASALIVSLMDGAALQYLIQPGVFGLDDYFQASLEAIARLLGASDETLDALGEIISTESKSRA